MSALLKSYSSASFTTEIAPAITVRLAEAADAARWESFVQSCPEATFFHRFGWKNVIEQAFDHPTYYFLAECDGKVEGILPLAHIKSHLFANALVSLPFCVYGGIVAATDSARKALDSAAQKLASNLKVGHLEYRNRDWEEPGWQTKNLYVTFRKPILPTVEENMLAIPRKQRAMVRKAQRFELRSETDSDIDRFYQAYSTSVHRLGTPVFSKRFFQLLTDEFGPDCNILTITKEGKVVSSVLSFYFRDEVLPYYGGGTAQSRELAANDYMYWELIRKSCEQGYKLFDFGRSKLGTGSFDFKKNWGFEPHPLPYAYQLHGACSLPDVNPLNPKYRMFIKMWQQMPLWMANAIGPHLAKNLG